MKCAIKLQFTGSRQAKFELQVTAHRGVVGEKIEPHPLLAEEVSSI